MKLFYYRSKKGNIGDDLNAWLWPREIPNLASISSFDHLVGIGTILDDRLDSLQGQKIICGSGYRPNTGRPWRRPKERLRDDWTIAWVRGPLTAQTFGLPESSCITDPALLLADHVNIQRQESTDIGFVPHFHTLAMIDCDKLARECGLRLISPELDVEEFAAAVMSVGRVIAEAMHGAIISDTLGIPWSRLRAMSWSVERARVAEYKWADWTKSMGLSEIPLINAPTLAWPTKGALSINRKLRRLNGHRIEKTLARASLNADYCLSDRPVGKALRAEMRERLVKVLQPR